MTTLQQHIIETLGAKPTINPVEEILMRVDFLKDFLLTSQRKGFVLGISGGQDSTLAGKLCQLAVNELNDLDNDIDYTFLPVLLPYKTQADAADAVLAVEFITEGRTQGMNLNIAEPVDGAVNAYNAVSPVEMSQFSKGNVKARVRMIMQYALASEMGLLVVGSDQNAELIGGYYTLFGDSGCDVTPLSRLNKRQGKALLIELGAPTVFYTKKPTADLLDNAVGQPDEVELGVTYENIDDYLEGKAVPPAVAKNIETRYLVTEHKRQLPTTPFDTWWK